MRSIKCQPQGHSASHCPTGKCPFLDNGLFLLLGENISIALCIYLILDGHRELMFLIWSNQHRPPFIFYHYQ